MIEGIHLDRLRLPLDEPYKLALGAVIDFDTIIVRMVTKAKIGMGEATILTGYTEETIEDGWARAKGLAPRLTGSSLEAARALVRCELADAPFTLSDGDGGGPPHPQRS
jgi:hypothetical protein